MTELIIFTVRPSLRTRIRRFIRHKVLRIPLRDGWVWYGGYAKTKVRHETE